MCGFCGYEILVACPTSVFSLNYKYLYLVIDCCHKLFHRNVEIILKLVGDFIVEKCDNMKNDIQSQSNNKLNKREIINKENSKTCRNLNAINQGPESRQYRVG